MFSGRSLLSIALLSLAGIVLTSCDTPPPESEVQSEAVRETASGAMLSRQQAYLKSILETGIAADEQNCPIAANDPCAMVNIVVELADATSPLTVGHTGIGISDVKPGQSVMNRNDLYYDFGPGAEESPKEGDDWNPGLYKSFIGRPWWDSPKHFGTPEKDTSAKIGLKDILDSLPTLAGDHTVVRFPICVTKAHASKIVQFWDTKMYTNPPPTYSAPGLHCTSSVAQSFEFSHPNNIGNVPYFSSLRTLTPNDYPARIQASNWNPAADYRHQCGAAKGQLPKGLLLRKWSGL